MYGNGIRSYRKTNVVTADPGRLVLMCYEGIIDQLKIAKQAYHEKQYEKKYKAIEKAQNLIGEMLCSLNFEKGGSIARNLKSLYIYMTQRIVSADVEKRIDDLNEVIGMLSELKSAWEIALGKKAGHIPIEAVPFAGRAVQPASGRISA